MVKCRACGKVFKKYRKCRYSELYCSRKCIDKEDRFL